MTVHPDDILTIELGPIDRLDAIRVRGDKVYVIAIARRGRVRTRVSVEIDYADAARLARFLIDIKLAPREWVLEEDDDDEDGPTDPGKAP
jgi:hypothetical protein